MLDQSLLKAKRILNELTKRNRFLIDLVRRVRLPPSTTSQLVSMLIFFYFCLQMLKTRNSLFFFFLQDVEIFLKKGNSYLVFKAHLFPY